MYKKPTHKISVRKCDLLHYQVVAPPSFAHEPGARPQKRPGLDAELVRANSRSSVTTLSQFAEARKAGNGGNATAGAAAAWRSNSERSLSGNGSPENQGQHRINFNASQSAFTNTADRSYPTKGMVLAKTRLPPDTQDYSSDISAASSQADVHSPPYYKDEPLLSSYELSTPRRQSSRAVSPLSQAFTPSSPPLQSENEVQIAQNASTNATAPAAAN